jgi:undecaprenyl-diphosphatase
MFSFFAEAFDLPILNWIQAHLQSTVLDFIMPYITILGDAGIFWIACAVILMFIPKHRKAGFSMGIALIFGVVVCNMILKPLVGRIRPYNYNLEVLKLQWQDFLVHGKLLVETPHDFSFPSGHTIASFEASVALYKNNKRLGIPALILASLISFSRMYLYVHYPTDVIASVILGTVFALIANWIVHTVAAKLANRQKKAA